MKIRVTGAAGFIGRHLARRLIAGAMEFERLTLTDARMPDAGEEERVRAVVGDIADHALRARALEGGVDVLFHIAGVPSFVSERDPVLSRRVNLDAALSLFEEAAAAGERPRVVYTSSIGVYGAPLPPTVDDATPIEPALVYGTHKRMMELALADLTRRDEVDGIALRLPGILARPRAVQPVKAAYTSEIFRAFAAGEPVVAPVSENAHFWCMSVARCVDNLIHAAAADAPTFPKQRVLTLPALRLSVPELAAALARATGNSERLVSYEPDAQIEHVYGSYPPLTTRGADRAGFRHDGDADALVADVLKELNR
jgi:nucleoside-diphosphate-sugar epimerase